MSDQVWKLVYDPLTGNFDLRRVPLPVAGGMAGGNVRAGTLVFPNGVELEMNEGMGVTGSGEILLQAGSTILLLP